MEGAPAAPLLTDPQSKKPYKIYGHVSKGFEPALQKFISLFDEGVDKNSQLCVYHKGEKVIDIWGETPGSRGKEFKFSPDSLVLIFSAGKTIGSIMMAILHDKGLIDFNEKIATYWPEFG